MLDTVNTHTHTHVSTYKHRPELMLNANLTSSERCVELHRLMWTDRAKSWKCVIAATHKHITGLYQGCVQVSETGWFICLSAPFCSSMTSNRLAFLSSPNIYFSVWTAHKKPCTENVDNAFSLGWHSHFYNPAPGTHQHFSMHAE